MIWLITVACGWLTKNPPGLFKGQHPSVGTPGEICVTLHNALYRSVKLLLPEWKPPRLKKEILQFLSLSWELVGGDVTPEKNNTAKLNNYVNDYCDASVTHVVRFVHVPEKLNWTENILNQLMTMVSAGQFPTYKWLNLFCVARERRQQ